MKRYLLIIVGCIVPMLLSSQGLRTHYISLSLYDYVFGEGSYWVYENEASVIDSLVLTNVVHDFNPAVYMHGELVMPPVEYFQTFYESKTLNYQTWDQFIGYVIVREGVNWGNNGQYIFLSSYDVGDKTGGAEIVQIYDTLNIGEHEFHQVTKMYIANNLFENNSPTYYYFAKETGIIRKEILSSDTSVVNETWNIKDFDAIKMLYEGINELENKDRLIAYPNPTDRFINISLSEQDLNNNLYLIDLKGNIIYSNKILTPNIEIDLLKFNSGCYFLVIENKNLRKSIQVIKK